MLRAHLRLTLFFTILATTVVLHASRPVFWQTASVSDFVRGEVENLSIDNTGRLLLGPRTELLSETAAPFLWSIIAAPDGSLYVGSGNEGKVFKVDPAGRTTTFFDAPELEVHAIVLAPSGDLYVGTSPDGQIYKVDSAGRGTPFFDPDAKYIWSLALDVSGNVYAATGERGIIYKIAPDGTGTTFYQTRATHAISLTFDREGQLLAGTESPGRLFRIDRGGKAFLLLDSTFQEIHAIRLDPQGVIYATALSARPSAGDARPAQPTLSEPAATTGREPTATVTTEVLSIAIVDVGAGSTPQPETPRDDRRGPRGAIYRIKPDGLWDVLWESGDESPYDLTFDATGALLVGTGRGGKLFRLTGDPATATLLMHASAQQITGFAKDAKGTTYYATSNPGKIFRLSSQRATDGSYISPVRDTETVSDWGTLSWRANVPAAGSLEIYTRSGNTAAPDDTWSAWAGPYQRPDGDDIRSPNARYLQWRAVLAGKEASPVLTSVTAAYLQRNLRPEVTSVTVHPPGTVFQKPFPTGDLDIAGYDDQAPDRKILTASSSNTGGATPGTTALGRRAYQRGLQTFVWRAEDENGDELRYSVLYRQEGDTVWKILKEDLADPIFVWDTASVPNGTYFVKIVASDEATNPVGSALQGELESAPLDIDNTPPTITVTGSRQDAGGATVLQFEVRDDLSAVQKVEYSLDAERWRISYPMDGIFDSRLERFELPLDGDALVKGLIIRAADAKNNTATGRGEVPARPR